MAILLSEVPEPFSSEALPHKTWTRAELEVLESTGLLEGCHFELIEGELIDKLGKKRKHVRITMVASRILRALFGDEYVDTEAPIDVASEDNPRNEPEPDIVVLRRSSEILESNPTPADVALVVEVSDSTLRQVRTVKARLYARAGMQEYRVIDVNNRRL